ncbi:MAG TPA: amidohydrolase family protein, partial [Polyangia bacterium]
MRAFACSWLRLVALLVAAPASAANAQPRPPSPTPPIALRAERLLDVKTGRVVKNAVVIVDGERIRAAGDGVKVPPDATVIDLGAVTLLPGLIDCHTHLMARIPDGRNGYAVNLLTKSQAFRALEGAADARATLLAGFTAVR